MIDAESKVVATVYDCNDYRCPRNEACLFEAGVGSAMAIFGSGESSGVASLCTIPCLTTPCISKKEVSSTRNPPLEDQDCFVWWRPIYNLVLTALKLAQV